ncbi:hypothetical protein C3L33_12815, partial [Rhododendron williamsianum]
MGRYRSRSRSPSPRRSSKRYDDPRDSSSLNLVENVEEVVWRLHEASRIVYQLRSLEFWPLDRRARDDDYSPRRSRSVSKSVSPRDERNYRSKMKSPRRSRSISRSPSPRDKRNYRSDLRSPSPRVNGKNQRDERYDEQSRSQSPRRNARIPSRSPSRSLSYDFPEAEEIVET